MNMICKCNGLLNEGHFEPCCTKLMPVVNVQNFARWLRKMNVRNKNSAPSGHNWGLPNDQRRDPKIEDNNLQQLAAAAVFCLIRAFK